jgi:hypothetical protein
MKKNLILAVVGCASLLAAGVHAGSITYVTPGSATQGGQPVDAEADFTVSAGEVSILLKNLEANPTSVIQLISDLSFTLSGSQTSGTMATTTSGSSGQEITVNGGGSSTLGSTVPTGWSLSLTGFHLNVLGTPTGPSHLIIGPPDGSGNYSNANGSIAGNGPHNPFLNGSASFTIDIPGLTASETVTSATFSFGTTDGNNTQGITNTVPDGGITVLLLGAAVSGLGLVRRKLN